MKVMHGRIPCLLIGLAVLAGCSDSSSAPHPVQGQVLLGDQPLAEAIVIFHPQQETLPGQPKPLGISDAEGKFQLTTLQSHDGAPAGEYRVTVELRQERFSGEELTRDGSNLLPAAYARPETTPFKATVSSGDNVLPPLRLEK